MTLLEYGEREIVGSSAENPPSELVPVGDSFEDVVSGMSLLMDSIKCPGPENSRDTFISLSESDTSSSSSSSSSEGHPCWAMVRRRLSMADGARGGEDNERRESLPDQASLADRDSVAKGRS